MIIRYVLLFAMFVFGYQLYAQDISEAQRLANWVGSGIVCDSLGRPLGELDIIDNEYGSCLFVHAFVKLFTKPDMVHIDKFRVSRISIKDDDDSFYEPVSEDDEFYPVILAIIQRKVQEGLNGGFIVYPEQGIMSERVSYATFMARFRINVFPGSPCYSETTSQLP